MTPSKPIALFTLFISMMMLNPQRALASEAESTPSVEAISLNSADTMAKADNDWKPNLGVGHWTAGGNFGISQSTYSGTYYFFNPEAEYFVSERLSLGGMLSIGKGTGTWSLGLGPSFTYYFFKDDRWAASTGASVIYSKDSWENDGGGEGNVSVWRAKAKVGLDYFFTPSVSFGPRLQYSSSIGSSKALYRDNDASLVFQFSVHL